MSRTGWLMAMESELLPILSLLEKPELREVGPFRFFTGQIHDQDVLLVYSGIGKVFSAAASALAISEFDCNSLINIGLGGGIGKSLHVGEWVFSTSCVQADYDTSVLDGDEGFKQEVQADKSLLEKAESIAKKLSLPYEKGLIATQDLLLSREEDVKKLFSCFDDSLAADMEGGAVAEIANSFNVPFLVIRQISDLVFEENNEVQFATFRDNHCQDLKKFVQAWYQ